MTYSQVRGDQFNHTPAGGFSRENSLTHPVQNLQKHKVTSHGLPVLGTDLWVTLG